MGVFANIGGWSEGQLWNWVQQRLQLAGNIRNTVEVALVGRIVPTGQVSMYAGASAPTGYLLCDGGSYLRSEYQDLFDAIGTTFGAADATHFNVPDLRGRVPVGLGTHADVNALGDSDGLAVASRKPGHVHDHEHEHTFAGDTGAAGAGDVIAYDLTTVNESASPAFVDASHQHAYTDTTDPMSVPQIPTDSASPSYLTLQAIIKT